MQVKAGITESAFIQCDCNTAWRAIKAVSGKTNQGLKGVSSLSVRQKCSQWCESCTSNCLLISLRLSTHPLAFLFYIYVKAALLNPRPRWARHTQSMDSLRLPQVRTSMSSVNMTAFIAAVVLINGIYFNCYIIYKLNICFKVTDLYTWCVTGCFYVIFLYLLTQ